MDEDDIMLLLHRVLMREHSYVRFICVCFGLRIAFDEPDSYRIFNDQVAVTIRNV